MPRRSLLGCTCTFVPLTQHTAPPPELQDPLRVWKMLAWMALALVALAVHELRPYKVGSTCDTVDEGGTCMHTVCRRCRALCMPRRDSPPSHGTRSCNLLNLAPRPLPAQPGSALLELTAQAPASCAPS